jgi:two-component system OmpR family response regulator
MKTARILLVDDEVAFANNIAKLISKRGFEVKTVYDGQSAIQALDESDFDVIVLDLKMPGLDGMAALRLIKGKKPQVEVIILTGHGSMESGIDGIQLGAFDFIMKPVRFDDLHEKIREAYQRKLVQEGQEEKVKLADALMEEMD